MNAISNIRFRAQSANRARVGETLSDDAIAAVAPSVFAGEAHDSRSSRYAFIPTSNILTGMRSAGFAPVYAAQSKCRDVGKREHTKHMLRFRRTDTMVAGEGALMRVGQVFPEVVLVNSHDGSSSYHLHAGLFRLVCLNGMVVDAGNIAALRIGHTGNVTDRVVEGSFEVMSESVRALTAATDWSVVQLNRDERMAFAEQAHALRFGDPEEATTPIKPEQLLQARRRDDGGSDLWRTFNTVQESVIRGGLHAWGRDANNRPRRVTTREVRGIDQDVRLNRALWRLTERMAEIKGAATVHAA